MDLEPYHNIMQCSIKPVTGSRKAESLEQVLVSMFNLFSWIEPRFVIQISRIELFYVVR